MYVNYCLDALREDIICHADDTPRYTTKGATLVTGLGQERQCRNWQKLQTWASERGACYKKAAEGKKNNEIETYDFCPGISGLPSI